MIDHMHWKVLWFSYRWSASGRQWRNPGRSMLDQFHASDKMHYMHPAYPKPQYIDNMPRICWRTRISHLTIKGQSLMTLSMSGFNVESLIFGIMYVGIVAQGIDSMPRTWCTICITHLPATMDRWRASDMRWDTHFTFNHHESIINDF